MMQFNYTLKEPYGLHARIAASLIKFTSTLTCDVTMCKQERLANAKRLFGVMSLSAKLGEEVSFMLDGANADEECQKLQEYCITHF